MKAFQTSIKLILFTTFLSALVAVGLACGSKEQPTPPVAKISPKVDTFHSEIRTDDYFWLRDREDPDVIAYLEAENQYAEEVMAHTNEFQKELYDEILSRIKETDEDVPTKIDDYYYYTRTEEGKQYRIYCRKKGSLDAEEEIYLDQNVLAENYDYFDIATMNGRPDHNLLAYSMDTLGRERFTLVIKDLNSGEYLKDTITDIGYSVVWANDNKTLFYTMRDEANRPHKAFRHKLGSKQADDPMVFHEEDDAFWMGMGKSSSEKYIFIGIGSKNTSEYHYIKADQPDAKFKIITPRVREVEYDVDHHDDRFLIMTNKDAQNFKLVEAPIGTSSMDDWEEVIPHRTEIKLDGMDLFEDYMVIYEREKGLNNIHVYNFSDGSDYYIDFPEPIYTVSGGANPEYETDKLRFIYYSMVTPRSVYDYDLETRERELKKQQEVLGGYDPSQYETKRVYATSHDGTEIPISMVYKKDQFKQDGTNLLYLYVYGAYGSSMDPWFSSVRLSLLDRGFVWALAHVRGGGLLGRQWYEEGKLLKKRNTFLDLIACGEHLVKESYTSKEKMVVAGGSAGGMTVGATMNMRPDLFEIVIAQVPFVDVINTMMDPTIPLTVVEYDEWGNPNDEEYYNYMRSYSPYDNVKAQDYPTILITAGLNDPRVQYWEPAKWTAKLRATKTDDNPLLFKIKMGEGHMGASGRYDAIKDIAFEYAFILDHFGINK